MRFRQRPTLVAILATLCACAASQASAQGGVAAPRAPQGLFGAVRPPTDRTRLNFTASLVEGYDDDVPTQFRQVVDPTSLQAGGFWTMFSGTADYMWSGKRGTLVGNAASNFRHYADIGETRSVGHAAGVGMTLRLPARTTLFLNQAVASTPAFLFDLFPSGATIEPGETPTTAPDYSVSTFESYAYTTTMVLRHDFSPRKHFTATGDYSFTDRLRESPVWQDVNSHSLSGVYSQSVTRNTSLSGQYRYRKGTFGYTGDLETTEHGVDVGVEFSRPLSATRRAVFNFKVGASRADVPEFGAEALVLRRQYLKVGDVGFGYEFAQTWQARANFRRGVEYIVDLPHPVFADSVSFSLAGLLSRRVDVLASAGYSSGESLLNRDSLRFDTYTGNLRLRYAMSRSLATYVDYLYYYYDFLGGLQLLAGMPTGLARTGIRAGVTLWVPVLRR